MNKRAALAAILALLILALLSTSAVGYMRLARHLDEAQAQSKSADLRAQELEQKIEAMNTDVAEAKRIADERGREVSTLRNQAAELEKQVAELKSKPQMFTTWQDAGAPGQPVILNWNAQTPQMQEAMRRFQLDVNGAFTPQAITLTPGLQAVNGVTGAIGGLITIDGKALKFGDAAAGEAPAPAEDGAAAPQAEKKVDVVKGIAEKQPVDILKETGGLRRRNARLVEPPVAGDIPAGAPSVRTGKKLVEPPATGTLPPKPVQPPKLNDKQAEEF